MLGIHWLCVGVYIQCAFRFAIETMKMHAIWGTGLDSNAAFNNQLKRWIKWHMRTDQTKWNKQNKTQKAPHLLWNCIKKLCSLPIAIDVYLCFISLRNIRIVKRKKKYQQQFKSSKKHTGTLKHTKLNPFAYYQ